MEWSNSKLPIVEAVFSIHFFFFSAKKAETRRASASFVSLAAICRERESAIESARVCEGKGKEITRSRMRYGDRFPPRGEYLFRFIASYSAFCPRFAFACSYKRGIRRRRSRSELDRWFESPYLGFRCSPRCVVLEDDDNGARWSRCVPFDRYCYR